MKGTIRSVAVLAFCGIVAYNQITTAQRVDVLEEVVLQLYTDVAVERLERHSQQPQPRFTPSKRSAEFQIIATDQRIDYQQLDLFCLAKNIFHEAGVEDLIGKYAVAQVTLNRVDNRRYPNTICDVVMQPYQFSWANDRSQRWTHPRGPLWEQSKAVAELVLKQGHRLQGLEAANYYHADYVSPRWASDDYKITQLGTHVFYAQAARR